MELMLIVWLVSILSNIKLFVSSYTVVCVIIVLAVYLVSKINIGEIRSYLIKRANIPDLLEGQFFKITSGDFRLDEKATPAGTYKVCHVYQHSNRLSATHLESNGDFLLDLNKVRLHLDVSGSTQYEAPPTVSYTKQLRTSGYVAIGMIVASVLLPSDTTMKYMAGAYLVQSVYESDLVQSAAPIARDAVNNQLKLWAKDTPDMDVLVRQAEQAAAAVKVVENVGPTSDPSK